MNLIETMNGPKEYMTALKLKGRKQQHKLGAVEQTHRQNLS